jgi:hypothetical protein
MEVSDKPNNPVESVGVENVAKASETSPVSGNHRVNVRIDFELTTWKISGKPPRKRVRTKPSAPGDDAQESPTERKPARRKAAQDDVEKPFELFTQSCGADA